MNPHAAPSISPLQIVISIISNKSLLYGLIKREIIGRYRGSMLGLLWSFFNPVLTLAIYTFVFSMVFQARAGSADRDRRLSSPWSCFQV